MCGYQWQIQPSSGHCVVQVWKIRRDPMGDASETEIS